MCPFIPAENGMALSFPLLRLMAMHVTQIEIPFIVTTVNGGVPAICKSGEQRMHQSFYCSSFVFYEAFI